LTSIKRRITLFRHSEQSKESPRLSKNFYNLIVISYKIIPKNLKVGEIFMKKDWENIINNL